LRLLKKEKSLICNQERQKLPVPQKGRIKVGMWCGNHMVWTAHESSIVDSVPAGDLTKKGPSGKTRDTGYSNNKREGKREMGETTSMTG